jgi:hypothetical protein
VDRPQHLLNIGHVLQRQASRHQVEAIVSKVIVQTGGVAGDVPDAELLPGFLLHGVGQHARRDIDASDSCAAPRQLAGEVAGPATHIEDLASAYLAAEFELRRPEQLKPVEVAPGRLSVCVGRGRCIPVVPHRVDVESL